MVPLPPRSSQSTPDANPPRTPVELPPSMVCGTHVYNARARRTLLDVGQAGRTLWGIVLGLAYVETSPPPPVISKSQPIKSRQVMYATAASSPAVRVYCTSILYVRCDATNGEDGPRTMRNTPKSFDKILNRTDGIFYFFFVS